MANKKTIEITLLHENGEEKTHKAGKIMARTTHQIMKMYAKEERGELDGFDMLNEMLDIVADAIFKHDKEVTVDALLDGIESDQIMGVLNETIMVAMGLDEDDLKEAEEGK